MENLSSKSLMIGDWVRLTDPIAEGMQVQVLAIGRFGSITFYDGITDHIEPIPLTAEILDKNKFKNYRLSYDNGDYYYHIALEDVKGGLWIDVVSSRNVLHGRKEYCGLINYVHELQNAMKLCGIEKEIVL